VILSDSTTLLDYMLERMTFVLDGLLVYPENLLRSMDMSHGLVYSQRVMLELVARGMRREEAYDLVQKLAMRAWDEGCDYKALLQAKPEVTSRIPAAELDECFLPEKSFGHIDEIYRRNGLL